MTSRFPSVPDSAARSVAGPTAGGGLRDNTVTSGGLQTLTIPDDWKERYLYVYAEDADIYMMFADSASATFSTTAVGQGGSAPIRIFRDQYGRDMVCTGKYARFKSKTGTGILTILRA